MHPPGAVSVTVNPLEVKLQDCPKDTVPPLQGHPPKLVQRELPEKLKLFMQTEVMVPLTKLVVFSPCTFILTLALPLATRANSLFSNVGVLAGLIISNAVAVIFEQSPEHIEVGFAVMLTSKVGGITVTVTDCVQTVPVPVVN